MSELLNVGTKQIEFLPDDKIQHSVLNGTHAYAAGARVKVKNPDGQLVTIPSEKVYEAFNAGYLSYGPKEEALDSYANENKGLKGDLKAAAYQFVNQSAFGIPGIVHDNEADDFARAKLERLKKDHDGANMLGGAAGLVANAFVGGPIFKAAAKGGELTSAAIQSTAANIAASTGANIGVRGASSVAKGIVSKMAGGAVEGALISAPAALTEAALGDPELAGEALLWGGGAGALLGGTIGAAGEIMSLGKRASKKSYEWLEGKEVTSENMAMKLAEYGFGTPVDDIKAYQANKVRIKAREEMTTPDLKVDIDRRVGARLADEEVKFQSYKKAEDDAQNYYNHELASLKADKPGIDMANEITSRVGETKAKLGAMSEEADNFLLDATLKVGRKETPITWRKQDLLADITHEIKKLRPEGSGITIGKTAIATEKELGAIYARVKTGYEGKDLTGTQMRDLMRHIRKENQGAFDRSAGEFGEHLSNALMGISEKMSGRIKSKLDKFGYTDYSEQMAKMSDLSRNLKEMDKLFGRENIAYSTLRGYTGARGALIEKNLSKFDELNGTNFISKMEKYKAAKDLLELSKLDDLRSLLIPNQHGAALAAKSTWQEVQSRNDSIRALSELRSQPAIENQMRLKPNVETKKAFDALSDMEGLARGHDDFSTVIDDMRINRSFETSRINGSRRVNAFGAVGAAVGGTLGSIAGPVGTAIGAAAGGAAGFAIDIDGGKLLKKLLDGETFLGPLFAEKSMKTAAIKLDKIPEILAKLHQRATTSGAWRPAPVDAVRLQAIRQMVEHLVEPEKRQDKQSYQDKINDELSDLVSNPDLLMDRVGHVFDGARNNGAPITSEIAATKLITAVTYLNTHLPKPPRMDSPFSSKVQWKPSDFQLKGFQERFEIVADPLSVLDHLENGSLTKNHMQSLKTVYPALHSKIQQKVLDSIVSQNYTMNHTDRLKLSLVMGMPLDVSMMNISRSQQMYQKQPQDQPAEARNFKANINVSGQYGSDLMTRGER